jgi:hypothetical protein
MAGWAERQDDVAGKACRIVRDVCLWSEKRWTRWRFAGRFARSALVVLEQAMGEPRIYNMAFRSGDEDQVGIVLNEASSMVCGKNRRRERQYALARAGVLATNCEAGPERMSWRNVGRQGKLIEHPSWFPRLREMSEHACSALQSEGKDFEKAEVTNENIPFAATVNQNGSCSVFRGEFEVRRRWRFCGVERSVRLEAIVVGVGIHMGIKKPRLDSRGIGCEGWWVLG